MVLFSTLKPQMFAFYIIYFISNELSVPVLFKY